MTALSSLRESMEVAVLSPVYAFLQRANLGVSELSGAVFVPIQAELDTNRASESSAHFCSCAVCLLGHARPRRLDSARGLV